MAHIGFPGATLAVLLGLMIAVVGGIVFAVVQRPKSGEKSGFEERPLDTNTVALAAFDDPALTALVIEALAFNADLRVSAARVEQAAGMASYVAGYRIGMLASMAGALFLVSGFERWLLEEALAVTASVFL